MKQIATIFFSFLLVFTFLETVEGQTTVYSDSFTGENGKGKIGTDPVDFSGVDWSVDVSGGDFTASSDYFAVQSGVFEAQDVDGTITWTSETFDISGYSSLDFSFDAGADGDFEDDEDIFKIEIVIDGTPEILFNGIVDENVTDDPIFFGGTQLTNSLQKFSTSISGSGLNAFIKITVFNNAGNELFRFDNLEVKASTNPTQLSIKEINNGDPLFVDVPFDVVIQAQDASGNPSIVNSNLNISLLVSSESGSLSGTKTGTISGGTSEATISGATYNVAESGVTMEVTDNTSTLSSGSSNSLTFSELNIVLNEIFADPPTNIDGDANGDGTRDSSDDEFVEFVNNGDTNLDISGWDITDGSDILHTFPSSTILSANQAIVIFGGGNPTGNFGNAMVQVATNTSGLGLTNGGDTVILRNLSDNNVINFTYGSEASSDESITRNPELTGNFAQHSNVDPWETIFSPGTQVGGHSFLPFLEITGNEGWRMLSTPTSNNSFDDLLNPIWTQGSSTGADYTGGEPNVLTYDGTDFNAVDDLTLDMTAGEGFIVYVYSDDNFDNSPDGFPKILEMSGTKNSADLNLTTSSTPALNDGQAEATLLGNPFLIPIDWDNLNSTANGITGVVYVYDHTYGTLDTSETPPDEEVNATGATGNYRAWNGTDGSLIEGVISPFQGFWIVNEDVSSPSPSLTISRDNTVQGGTFLKSAENEQISVNLRAETNYMFNEAFLSFNANGQLDKDNYDGLELTPLDHGDYISLSTEVEGTQMDINNLPVEFYNPIEIPLHVQAYEAVESGWSLMGGEVTLSWPEMNNIPSEWKITLTDKKLNRTIDLKSANNYVFEAEGSQAKIANKEPFSPFNPKPFQKEKSVNDARFLITINPNVPDGLIDDNIPDQFTLEQNYPNPFNPTTNIKFEIAETSDVTLNVYNVMGQRVATLVNEVKAPGTYEIAWNAQEVASGIYYYRLRAGGVVFNKQMTLIK